MLNLSQIQNLKKFRVCEEGWGEVGSSDANKKTSPYPFRAYPPINPITFYQRASLTDNLLCRRRCSARQDMAE